MNGQSTDEGAKDPGSSQDSELGALLAPLHYTKRALRPNLSEHEDASREKLVLVP